MKKYNLFKVVVVTIIIAIALTLFVPGSSADYTGNITKGSVEAVGIWALFANINISLSYFSNMAFYLIAIAIFYLVLGKTTSYNAFINRVVNAFQGKETLLTTLSIVIFGILAAVVSEPLILLVFVPFMYSVMSGLNVDKKTILASTIVALLFGAMCGIYNSTLFTIFSLKLNTLLLVKVILLIIVLFILTIYVAPNKNKKEEKKVEDKKVVAKANAKKASAPKTATKKSSSKTTTKKAVAKKPATKKTAAKTTTRGRKKVTR